MKGGKTVTNTNKEALKSKKAEECEAKKNQQTTTGFFEEIKQELAKVVWPSRQQLVSESVAVLLMVTLVATLIYIVDQLFGWMAGKVF